MARPPYAPGDGQRPRGREDVRKAEARLDDAVARARAAADRVPMSSRLSASAASLLTSGGRDGEREGVLATGYSPCLLQDSEVEPQLTYFRM